MSKDGYIEKTIEDLEVRKHTLISQLVETNNCIDTLRRISGCEPEKAEEIRLNLPEPKPDKKIAKPPYKAIKINGKLTYRKKSQYKGVSPLPPKRSGKIRYRSLYWDGKKGKPVTIDVLDRELEAAAVYQDFVGNKDKAAEYRNMDKRLLDEERHKADLKEQLENNPDRPIDGAARCEVRRKGGKIYVCNRCGLEYKSRGTCAGCGEKDMHEEPATS